MPRTVARLATLPVITMLAAAAGFSHQPDGLYQAVVVVTGYDMRSRPTGFAKALREVLVKVSGEPRLGTDARTSELAAHPDRLISGYNYADEMAGIKVKDDQGTYDRSYDLTVHFDKGRIDAALRELGSAPWLGERPAVEPVLRMQGATGPAYLLSFDGAQDPAQRSSFTRSGVTYGMAVRLPSKADLAAWSVTTDHVPPVGSTADCLIVTGDVTFSQVEPFGWNGSFQTQWQGHDYHWQIAGVGYDLAFDAVVRGALRLASGHDAPE